MHAAMPARSISPYIRIAIGPAWTTPELGDGMLNSIREILPSVGAGCVVCGHAWAVVRRGQSSDGAGTWPKATTGARHCTKSVTIFPQRFRLAHALPAHATARRDMAARRPGARHRGSNPRGRLGSGRDGHLDAP